VTETGQHIQCDKIGCMVLASVVQL